MDKISQESEIDTIGNSHWVQFLISTLGFLITIAYFPLELGFGLVRTSIPILSLAGVLVILTKSFQKIDSIDFILILLGFWITLVLVIFPAASSTIIDWKLFFDEIGSIVASFLTRHLCRKYSSEIIRGLVLGLSIQVLIGIYQVKVGPNRLNALGYVYPRFIFEPGGGFSRAFGSFFSPVIYGSFIAVLGIGLCNYYVNNRMKFLAIGLSSFLAIILSETRGALIAFTFAIVYTAVRANESRTTFSPLIFGYILIVGLLLATLFSGKSELIDRNISRIYSIQDATTDRSIITRKAMWQEASSLITKNPIIGGGTKYLLGEYDFSTPLLQYFKHPHSAYLFVALVYGIFPGLVLFLFLLWKLAYQRYGKTTIAVFMIAGTTETLWSSVNMIILVIVLSSITEKK